MGFVTDDGFHLEFEEMISDDEKLYYLKNFPNINRICEKRIHCTVCMNHIGTAPSQESVIRMHPILKVTHCKKCHEFYNSGEFTKGEDGSELYCRWCGQGGEVYCCSKCPFVFCKNCILGNLPSEVLVEIESNENWNCFSCAPRVLWNLRAHHWALMNFIEKQKQAILSGINSESEVKRLMTRDLTKCCKRVSNSVSISTCSFNKNHWTSTGRKRKNSNVFSTTKSMRRPYFKIDKDDSAMIKQNTTAFEFVNEKKEKHEVACPAELTNAFEVCSSQLELSNRQEINKHIRYNQQSLNSVSSIQFGRQYGAAESLLHRSESSTSLVGQNVGSQTKSSGAPVITKKTIVTPRCSATISGNSPVYHTINGFRIDLNSAAQQEIFRLPNGKLIQVKRQETGINDSNILPVSSSIATINKNSISNDMDKSHFTANPTIRNQNTANPLIPMVVNRVGRHHTITGFSIRQPQPTAIQYSQPSSTTSFNKTTLTSEKFVNGNLSASEMPQASRPIKMPMLIKQFFSATPLGQARSQLQNQIFSGMDICQHLTGKIHTLTHSNAYKTVKNYTDIKELYIHLSYLFTYAIGRFKSLQAKCSDDMKRLGFEGDITNLEHGHIGKDKSINDIDDEEIEIVEPKTTLIDLDSDNDSSNQTKLMDISPTLLTNNLENHNAECGYEVTANLLAGILEVQLHEGNEIIENTFHDINQKKTKTKNTIRHNSYLFKQTEQQIIEHEINSQARLFDVKLQKPCQVILPRIEQTNEIAKLLLEEHEKIIELYRNRKVNNSNINETTISLNDNLNLDGENHIFLKATGNNYIGNLQDSLAVVGHIDDRKPKKNYINFENVDGEI